MRGLGFGSGQLAMCGVNCTVCRPLMVLGFKESTYFSMGYRNPQDHSTYSSKYWWTVLATMTLRALAFSVGLIKETHCDCMMNAYV